MTVHDTVPGRPAHVARHVPAPVTGRVAVPVGGTLLAAGAFGYAQVALPEQPLLSDYALVPGGMLPVLTGLLALAGACLWLAYGLAVREPARTAATRVLLVAAAAGLLLCAVFPTDPGISQLSTVAGEIHRWAAAVVLTALPLAGWTLARRDTSPAWATTLRAMSVTSALALACFLLAHPASVTSAPIDGVAFYGLFQRGVVLAEIALVAVMATAVGGRRAATTPRSPRSHASAAGPAEAGARSRRLAA
ncbi:DUF998 domain-containing protein [Nonomuraea sp. NPDC047897]|uniref:DUF998 domain-containing protein n=1 Tax=Nonomuraea sp. NPDC047897 TaxID=3364346 RepID=UPI0037228708